jgi:dephospho-CoA kinase
MLKVGITGGIGSGKTTVCQVFETLGIPVLYADETARYLMDNDALLVDNIKTLFGQDIYISGKLDRTKVAATVFNQPGTLQQLNNLVHPAVIRYTETWIAQQQTPYVIKEAAIFFESGTNAGIDIMVGVYAPQELRIKRAMQRDNITREKVLARMASQMNEEEKMKLCDFVITNDEVEPIIPQVLKLHELFLEKIRG